MNQEINIIYKLCLSTGDISSLQTVYFGVRVIVSFIVSLAI